MPTLILSRALLRLVGVDYDDLGSVLSHDATQALRPFLEWQDFDLVNRSTSANCPSACPSS